MPNPSRSPLPSACRIARVCRRVALAAVLVVVAVPLAHASSPKFFRADAQADFLRGDVENLSIDGGGRLRLGPATELVYETPAPFLWAIVPATDGAVFVGTGNAGKVFRVDAQGHGSVFFDSAELEVHALAPAPNGGLYVGTSPNGKIYRVNRDGTSTVFFDPEDKYIWSIVVDPHGTVYAGTGEKGIVYKIAPDGTGTVLYKTTATHATALALDRAGNLLVGTGAPGRVLKIDPSGKPFVLLDSPFQEVHALRFDENGMLYAAALSGRASEGAIPSTEMVASDASGGPAGRALVPSVSVSTEITAIVVDASSAPPAQSRATDAVKGALYRIAPDGVWDRIWESREDVPYDVTFDERGAVILGTGTKGKIYRLEGNPLRPTLLARAGAQQVTAFHRDAQGRLYYATANPGKLFRLSAGRAARGSYESEPRDAQMVAAWGTLVWRGVASGDNRIELSTRSGNTETPDDAWSPWSAAYTNPAGSPIVSPKARYLQWRVVLTGTGEGPMLTSVSAAYLQRNLRPQVRSITVHPPGIVFQKPYTSGEPDLAGFGDQTTPERRLAVAAAQSGGASALGRRAYQKGLETLVWRADDENEDDLVYDVLYRREGETTWTPLRRRLSDTILVWDTNTMPDGTYFVKVVASDSPSNAADTALAGELESTPFEVDNTPPAIAISSVRVDRNRTVVTFDVTDAHSPISRVEASEDGQEWRGVFPADGMADSRQEHYEFVVDGPLAERGLTIRATDAMNNVETAHVRAPASAAGR